jgi:hypothetical protein
MSTQAKRPNEKQIKEVRIPIGSYISAGGSVSGVRGYSSSSIASPWLDGGLSESEEACEE